MSQDSHEQEHFVEFRQGSVALDPTFLRCYIPSMECEVVYTDEFETWWNGLSIAGQESVSHDVEILRVKGVNLRFPRCSGVEGSCEYSTKADLTGFCMPLN